MHKRYHYSSIPYHCRLKMAITVGFEGVGFNSLVIDGAITTGFKPDGDSPNNHRRF